MLPFLFNENEQWNQIVHVYFSKSWNGEPFETEEMRPEWFDVKNLPFEQMWSDDRYWLPLVLSGKKIIGRFVFKKDGSIEDYEIKDSQSWLK